MLRAGENALWVGSALRVEELMDELTSQHRFFGFRNVSNLRIPYYQYVPHIIPAPCAICCAESAPDPDPLPAPEELGAHASTSPFANIEEGQTQGGPFKVNPFFFL